MYREVKITTMTCAGSTQGDPGVVTGQGWFMIDGSVFSQSLGGGTRRGLWKTREGGFQVGIGVVMYWPVVDRRRVGESR